MNASDAMGRLFKAIGEYARSTSIDAATNDLKDANRNMQRALGIVLERRRQEQASEAPVEESSVIYTPHATGFTIDGSRRPGAPTRPGEQNSGEFIGLKSGHALACLKAWADKAGVEFDDSLGFEGNLQRWFFKGWKL